MGKPLLIEQIRDKVKIRGYDLLDDTYDGNFQKITLRDSEGYLYFITSANLLYQNKTPNRFHKANPYTIQNIQLFLRLHHPTLSFQECNYVGNNSKITLYNNEGYRCVIAVSVLTRGFTPAIFINSNPHTIDNINLWCKLNNKNYELLSNEYKSNTHKLIWKCHKEDCGEIFEANWDSILSGRKCSYCASKKVGISNCLATTNPELAKEFHPTKNGNLTIYTITSGSSRKVWWKCSKCSHEWKSDVAGRHTRRRGCPACNSSKGESRVGEFLKLNSICNEPFKEFGGLVGLGGGNLSYDFYLPTYNTSIEFQGRQHYEAIEHFGGEIQLEKQKIHDKIKREYCKSNNIKLIEIPYWDFDDIEIILAKELKLKSFKTNDIISDVIFNK